MSISKSRALAPRLTRQGQLGTLGGMGKMVEEVRLRREQFIDAGRAAELRYEKPKPEDTYLKGAAFGTMDMQERLQLLDQEGMAKSILYPTLGLLWECETSDAALSTAYATAYNRWIADFCHDSGGRLVPIAHLSLGDPEAAARELERAIKDGCKGAFVAPFTISQRPHADSTHDRIFAIVQDAGIPFAIYPTIEPPALGVHHRYEGFSWAAWYYDLFAAQGVQHAFATFSQLGVFDRFPRLKVVVLESGAGWIGYFRERADAIFSGTTIAQTVRLKEKPSYYFKRGCFISADPDGSRRIRRRRRLSPRSVLRQVVAITLRSCASIGKAAGRLAVTSPRGGLLNPFNFDEICRRPPAQSILIGSSKCTDCGILQIASLHSWKFSVPGIE